MINFRTEVVRQMGQFAMQCMLSCMTRAYIAYKYICVGSTAPSLDILLFAINFIHHWDIHCTLNEDLIF